MIALIVYCGVGIALGLAMLLIMEYFYDNYR